MSLLFVLVGFAALIVGGELFVRGAVAVALRLGLSPMLIGLTLVGFGTSLPELVTSVDAALIGSPGIAIGNVVGSNIANILLILAVAILIAPITVSAATFKRDGSVLAAVTLLCLVIVLGGSLSRAAGGACLAGLLAYLLFMVVGERRAAASAANDRAADPHDLPGGHTSLPSSLVFLLLGLIATIGGAHLLVGGAVKLASGLGVSESLIGMTIVAVGTSLPELVTSVIAARKGQHDVAFGNIIGSNIFNVLGIMGVTALVSPIQVPVEIAAFDVWVMVGASVMMVAMAITGWRLSRLEGGVLFACYLGYLAYSAAAAA